MARWVRSNINKHQDKIDTIKQDFLPEAWGVIRGLRDEILEDILEVWPTASRGGGRGGAAKRRTRAFKMLGRESLTRHIGAHPYATGESRRKMRVGLIKKGVRVRNKAKNSKGAPYFGYVLKVPNRRKTGLIFRLMPEIVERLDQRIRDEVTDRLTEALTPSTSTGGL